MCSSPPAAMAEVAVMTRAAAPARPSSRKFILFSRVWFRSVVLLCATPSRDEKGYCHKDDRDTQENRAHGIDLRRQRQTRAIPDEEGQRRLPGACHKLGDGEIVEGDDEGERPTGADAGHEERQGHPPEGL